MFNSISWQAYWLTLCILLAGYYLIIYLVYYRNGVRPDGTTPGLDAEYNYQSESIFSFKTAAATSSEGLMMPDQEHLIQACFDELSAYFEGAKRMKISKEDLLISISKILSKYPALRVSTYRDSIVKIIRSEAEHHCSIHISGEEVSEVWLGS